MSTAAPRKKITAVIACYLDAPAIPIMYQRLRSVYEKIGVNYEITPQVALRLAGMLGGASYLGSTNAIGFSIAWTPKGLKKF